MLRTACAIGVLNLLSLGCREAQNPVAPVSPVESPDYAVYDAVLDGLFQDEVHAEAPPRQVLSDSTMVGESIYGSDDEAWVRGKFGPLFAQLLDATRADYMTRSSVQVSLDARAFHARGTIEFLSGRTNDSLFKAGAANRMAQQHLIDGAEAYWNAFYERYPGSNGHISFSRPGYDASETHAFLAYHHGCGSLCADDGFVLLERRDGHWVILRRVITIMS